MISLWQLLMAELGSGFKNQFGGTDEDSFKYWSAELSLFTEQEIFAAFRAFQLSDERFINLKLMRQLCKDAKRETSQRNYPALVKLPNAAADGDEHALAVGNAALDKVLGPNRKRKARS